VGLRKPRTIITGIIITGTMVDTPSRATGTIIALVGRGEVPTWSQLVKQLGSVLLLSLTPDRWRFRIFMSALAGAPLYFLDRLPSMNFCEGLNDLSVR
jgi:hypothetical protein